MPLRASDENPVNSSKKALPAVFADKAFLVETTGIDCCEPLTSRNVFFRWILRRAICGGEITGNTPKSDKIDLKIR